MIKITSGTIYLTETTVRELIKAIEEAKKITKFTDKPLPDGDMSREDLIREKRKRGHILVKSPYTNIEYEIDLEQRPYSESLGYKLILGTPDAPDAIKIGKDGLCLCSCGDPCPLGRRGSELRCTEEELKSAGFKTIKEKYTE